SILSSSRSSSCCVDRSLEISSSSSSFFSRSSSSDLAVTLRCDAPDGAAVTIAGTPPDTLTGNWRTIVPPAGFAPVNSADTEGTTWGRAAGAPDDDRATRLQVDGLLARRAQQLKHKRKI